MYSKIQIWLSKHTSETHWIAGAVAFLVGAYFQVPAFHDVVTHYYGLMPQTAKELVTTAVALIGFYRNGQK